MVEPLGKPSYSANSWAIFAPSPIKCKEQSGAAKEALQGRRRNRHQGPTPSCTAIGAWPCFCYSMHTPTRSL